MPPGPLAPTPDGCQFHCVAVPPYADNGLSRLRNMLAFGSGMKRVLRAAAAAGRGPDLIIVSSPHPFAWRPLYRANRGSAAMIFEERDLWPLSLTQILRLSNWHPMVLYLRRLMRGIHREADAMVSLLPGGKGGDPGRLGKIRVIPNGVSPALWEGAAAVKLPERLEEAFAAARRRGRLVVLYAGAMGPPNGLEVLFDLAGTERERGYQIFLMGDGVSRPLLERRAVREGADYLTFLPRESRRVAWAAMRRADVLFFALGDAPELYAHGISLNKLFDYFMAAKPVVQVRAGGNHPVRDSGGGFELAEYRPGGLAEVLGRLAAMSGEERSAMGVRGREYALAHNNWDVLGERYAALCEAVVRDRGE